MVSAGGSGGDEWRHRSGGFEWSLKRGRREPEVERKSPLRSVGLKWSLHVFVEWRRAWGEGWGGRKEACSKLQREGEQWERNSGVANVLRDRLRSGKQQIIRVCWRRAARGNYRERAACLNWNRMELTNATGRHTRTNAHVTVLARWIVTSFITPPRVFLLPAFRNKTIWLHAGSKRIVTSVLKRGSRVGGCDHFH